MDNFDFNNTTRIVFGKKAENKTGELVREYAGKGTVLLHYGGGSIKKTGLYDTLTASLKTAGIEYIELPGVKPNPRLSMVYEGIELCRKNNIRFILAVGGGSVIDSAKAIAIGTPYQGDVWDFYSGKAVPKESISVGTVLTIPAAGSESSSGSVITNEEGWLKRAAAESNCMYPVFSVLDPELAFTLKKHQAACGIADIMAHLMERYFTNTQHVELTDRLIEAAMKTIVHNGPVALNTSKNYDAWAEVMWSGTIAHNNLLNTGRVGDWGSHDMEHELSAIYDIAHGAGLAVVFPAWMKYVYKHDIRRFVQFAVRVWNVDQSFMDDEETALEGIKRLESFYKSLGLAVRLKDLNITDERLDEMAVKCTHSDTHAVGNFVKLKQNDVHTILKMAL